MTSRVVRTKLVSSLPRGAAWPALFALAALFGLAIASCVSEDEDSTAAVSQANGSGGSSGGSGGGSGSDDPTAQMCPPMPSPVPSAASCLTAEKRLYAQEVLPTSGQAVGEYPIGIGQENQPPPDAYRADVCNRAWLDCVNGHLLPMEAMYCTSTCGGACASPSAPSPFGMTASTTYTIVPCGSVQCWRITCQSYGCAAQVGCCATNTGSGSGV